MRFSVQKTALSLFCLLSVASVSFSARADTVRIVLDQATILHLPNKVATIVIGNPSIADATLQAGGLLIVTGKGYGTTNLVALDSHGTTLAEHELHVSGAKGDGKLTIYRGVERETWSCSPKCEHSVVLGDSAAYFAAATAQIANRNGQSTGSAAK